MAGVKDIAKQAGVSPATVSNVLHHRKNVGEETRERVLKVAEELGYEVRERKAMQGGGKNTIIVNFSDFDTPYYLDVLHGISDYAEQRDYHLLICTADDLSYYAASDKVCGIIVIDQRTEDRQILSIADTGLPVVSLDRELSHPRVKSLMINNYEGERQLLEGLIEAGYRTFSYLKGPDTQDGRERYRAFTDVMKAHEIHVHRNDIFDGDWREKTGAQAARLLLLQEKLPQVLVCANDMMAIGAIRLFRENGIRVPEDIAVCGFDDDTIAKYIGLTTVSVPDYERGFLASQALLNIVGGSEDFETFRIGARVKWRKTAITGEPKTTARKKV